MRKYGNKIRNHQLFRKTKGFLQGVNVVKGSISLYHFLKLFFRKVHQDDIWEKANAIAFSFTLSIFPAIIFLFTLIPYIQYFYEPLDKDAIMTFLQEIFPASVYDFTSQTIEDIVGTSRGGLLTVGFLASAYLATAGMMSIIKAFNACYQTRETRGYFKTRALAASLTGIFALTLFVTILSLTLGETLINRFYPDKVLDTHYIVYLIYVFRLAIIYVMFFIVIAVIYYFAPAVKERWHFFSWGAMLSSLLSLLISIGFSLYINNFGTYNKLYGSIGALIALMVWFYILAVIILFGFELNATIDRAKAIHNGEAEDFQKK